MNALPNRQTTAAYLHIPFCAHHCGYCDFAVTAGKDHLMREYVDAIIQEMANDGPPRTVKTIFVGGGTPTRLSPELLGRFCAAVRTHLPLEVDGEWTIEANPDDITDERLQVLAQAGITRISLGVQSFRPELLPVLDRRHDSASVPHAIERCQRFIGQLSLDLIFGVPGQSLTDWERDLTAAISHNPDHISAYGLTYEKGTPLWKRLQRGEVKVQEEETERQMYLTAIDHLEAANYEQYELSNYAKPGKRCRHNETYWANGSYYGYGVGAARYIDGCRALNIRNTEAYLQRIRTGQPTTFQSETITGIELARETLMIGLRRKEGIDRASFLTRTGISLDALTTRLPMLVEHGLIIDDGDGIRLTREGKCVADAVIVQLL